MTDNIDETAELELTLEEVKEAYMEGLKSSWTSVVDLLSKADNMRISGKTLKEWHKQFNIQIPPNPSIEVTYELLSKTNAYITNSGFHLNSAQSVRDRLNAQLKAHKAKIFTSIKKAQKISNEQASLQTEVELEDLNNQVMLANYVVTFWENLGRSLISTRKMLEVINFSLNNELKSKNRFSNNSNNLDESESFITEEDDNTHEISSSNTDLHNDLLW